MRARALRGTEDRSAPRPRPARPLQRWRHPGRRTGQRELIMGYRIGKSFTFDAAHHLPSLPATHKCSRPHGHTYVVEAVLAAGELVGPGFVTDFGDLAPFARFIEAELDHRDLNAVVDFEPTSEALAGWLAGWFVEHVEPSIPGCLVAMRVAETPSSWGEYRIEAP